MLFFVKACTQMFMMQYLFLEISENKNTEYLIPTILANSANTVHACVRVCLRVCVHVCVCLFPGTVKGCPD